VLKFKGMNPTWSIQYKIDLFSCLRTPIEDRVLKIVVVIHRPDLLIEEGLNGGARAEFGMMIERALRSNGVKDSAIKEEKFGMRDKLSLRSLTEYW
jgi:hypothetical protein